MSRSNKKRVAEYRATLKGLTEQRNDLITELEGIVKSAQAEIRAMTDDEQSKFSEIEKQIDAIDKTIDAEERARNIPTKEPNDKKNAETRAAQDVVETFLRGGELRAGEMSTSTNGNILPSEFSSDIIRNIVELSGIFSSITRVNSKGEYKQILEKDKITAGWTNELAEVLSSTANFEIVTIGHHKLGALVKLSYELINQAHFPIVNEVTTQMVQAFTLETEKGVIKGTGIGQPIGLMSGGTEYSLTVAGKVTADELIKIFHTLKSIYFNSARWLMNRNTLCNIRLLKDKNDRFLFHEAELTSGFAGYILGKPVMLSEIVDDGTILFGDFTRAYKANVNPEMSIQIMNEVYASQGAKGVLGFLFFDGRPVDNNAYVVAQ